MRISQPITKAISMPMNLGYSNPLIVKRIIIKWSINENKRSDTSRYRATKKLVMAPLDGKTNENRRKSGE